MDLSKFCVQNGLKQGDVLSQQRQGAMRRREGDTRRHKGAPRKQECKYQRLINIWPRTPDGARHQNLLIDWPSIAVWLWLGLRIKASRVEAWSNTSTVALQVVGGNEKGSLRSEAISMVTSPMGLGPDNDCAGEGQQQLQKTDPSSLQRERPTLTNSQPSDNIIDLVASPRWVLYSKRNWPTDRLS
jgi:hypothetical protein